MQKFNKKSDGLEITTLNDITKEKLFNKKNFTRNDSLLDINNTFLNEKLIIRVKKNIENKKNLMV